LVNKNKKFDEKAKIELENLKIKLKKLSSRKT